MNDAGTLSPSPLPADTIPGSAEWRRARAREIIRDHTLLSVGASFVPFLFLDSLAVAAVELRMLSELSRLYGRDFDEDGGRNLLASLSLGFIHHAFTRQSAGAGWKLALARIPAIGGVLSFAALPGLFAVFTHLLGEACARHYEAGGQFSNFRAQQLVNTPVAPLAADLMNR